MKSQGKLVYITNGTSLDKTGMKVVFTNGTLHPQGEKVFVTNATTLSPRGMRVYSTTHGEKLFRTN